MAPMRSWTFIYAPDGPPEPRQMPEADLETLTAYLFSQPIFAIMFQNAGVLSRFSALSQVRRLHFCCVPILLLDGSRVCAYRHVPPQQRRRFRPLLCLRWHRQRETERSWARAHSARSTFSRGHSPGGARPHNFPRTGRRYPPYVCVCSCAESAAALDRTIFHEPAVDTLLTFVCLLLRRICCSLTHGALTPVDVVKTRMQLDPVKYNQGMIGGFRQVLLLGIHPYLF